MDDIKETDPSSLGGLSSFAVGGPFFSTSAGPIRHASTTNGEVSSITRNHHDPGLFAELDAEASNDFIQRILDDVHQVVEEDDDNLEMEKRVHVSEEAVGMPSFSVSATGFNDIHLGNGGLSLGAASIGSYPTGGTGSGAGGFVVEGATASASYSHPLGSSTLLGPQLPPYGAATGTPSLLGSQTPYSCYSGIPNCGESRTHIGAGGSITGMGVSKPPPPSFAEAVASTTPLSLQSRTPLEGLSPMHYVPPMPSAPQDTLLLRSGHGVFLMQPISKPTPPYTPAGTNGVSPPISPLPRYGIPAAVAGGYPLGSAAGGGNNFLGSSVAHAGGAGASGSSAPPLPHGKANGLMRGEALPPPPQYESAVGSQASSSPFLMRAYTESITSLRGTPAYGAAPPPYSAF